MKLAIVVRLVLAAAMIGYCVGVWEVPGAVFGLPVAIGVMLVHAFYASKWDQERGLWMYFAFWLALEIFLYLGLGPAMHPMQSVSKYPVFGQPPPSQPPDWAITVNLVLKDVVLFLVVRLMLSAIVHNWRRFRRVPHTVPA